MFLNKTKKMVTIALISLFTLIATATGQSCSCDWLCSLNRNCCPGCQEGLCSCVSTCTPTGAVPCCQNCASLCSCAPNCVSRRKCCFFCSNARCYCDALCSLTVPSPSCCSFCPIGALALVNQPAAKVTNLKQKVAYAARYTERYGRV